MSGNILLTEYAEESPAPVERVGPAVTPVRVVLAEDDVLLREGLAGPPC